jgi:hypothetical protein
MTERAQVGRAECALASKIGERLARHLLCS